MGGIFIRFALLPIFGELPFGGTVEGIRYHEQVNPEMHTPGGFKNGDLFRQSMTLTVRKPNGGTVVKQYTLEHGVYNTPYQTGDIVYRFRGTKFPMISERPGSDAAPRVCVCCGDIQDLKEETICFHCGKSIIEAADTEKC